MPGFLEPFLWLVALLSFWRMKDRARFWAFGIFLAIRAVAAFGLASLSLAEKAVALNSSTAEGISFYFGWISYLISFIALFFSLQEIFRCVISPLPGLVRLGSLCFRWAALVALLVACASLLPSLLRPPHDGHTAFVFVQISSGLCVLELCLVAFLMIALRALGHPARSQVFGICIGLVIMGMGDMVSLSAEPATGHHWLSGISEMATFLCLLVWMLYFVLAESQKQPATVPVAALMHWNDLALAIGQETKEPARTQSGFLHDVEHLVDRVLAKNAARN